MAWRVFPFGLASVSSAPWALDKPSRMSQRPLGRGTGIASRWYAGRHGCLWTVIPMLIFRTHGGFAMLFRLVALGILAGLSMPATAVADVFDDNALEGHLVCGPDNYSFTLIVKVSEGQIGRGSGRGRGRTY